MEPASPGRILYQRKTIPDRAAYGKRNTIYGLIATLILCGLLIFVKFTSPKADAGVDILLFLSFLSFFPAIRPFISTDYFIIFENGIQLPWRTIRQGIKKEHSFLRYDEISKIHVNETLPYICIELKTPKHWHRVIGIMKFHFDDNIDLLRDILRDKIQFKHDEVRTRHVF